MQHKPSVSYQPLIADEQAVNTFRRALSMFMGRGKRWKLEQVAKGAGIHPDTLGKFRSYAPGHPDHRSLDFGQLLSISAFLGADFTNEWLPLADQGAFDLPDDEPSPGTLATQLAEDTAAMVRSLNGSGGADMARIGGRLVHNGKTILAMAKAA